MTSDFEFLKFCSMDTLVSLFLDMAQYASELVADDTIKAIGKHVGATFDDSDRVRFLIAIEPCRNTYAMRNLVDAIVDAY